MRVDDLGTPPGEFVTFATFPLPPFTLLHKGGFFTASTRADDNIVAFVFAVPVAPSLTRARGAGLGQTTVYSAPAPSLPDGVSATTLGKAAYLTIPSVSPLSIQT